ncbi:MAG: polymer-forming cytoskeletal protein [Burkholderiales bacterium]|nr:polymer-forming cytoskeletal protein [Burkholderiales bacterium]
MSTTAAPAPFLAQRLKRKHFFCNADVHIQGDVLIATQLVVGGDLLVDGDLEAEEVFCLGKLTVTGNIHVQSLYVGQALDGGGNIAVAYLLKTGCSAEWMARMLELDQTNPKPGSNYLDRLVHPAILQRNAEHAHLLGGLGDIQALGHLACDDLDAQGNVQLDDALLAGEVLYIGGHLSARAIQVAGDCNCQGEVFCETDIAADGALFAASLAVEGNLAAASIHCSGNIATWGYLRATGEISSLNGEIDCARWIASKSTLYAAKYIKAGEAVVAEQGISAGKDYGILAGTALPRSDWEAAGFVSAKDKPRHILSGLFVADKKLKQLDALEKKRDWELDWEIPRRLEREAMQG